MRFTRKLIGGSFDAPTAQFYASQKLGPDAKIVKLADGWWGEEVK